MRRYTPLFILKGNGTNGTCSKVDSTGCIYEEFLQDRSVNSQNGHDAKAETFTIQLTSASNKAENVNIELCEKGCVSLYPYKSFPHFGVRWDKLHKVVKCWCLMDDAFDLSMIGPRVRNMYLTSYKLRYIKLVLVSMQV